MDSKIFTKSTLTNHINKYNEFKNNVKIQIDLQVVIKYQQKIQLPKPTPFCIYPRNSIEIYP